MKKPQRFYWKLLFEQEFIIKTTEKMINHFDFYEHKEDLWATLILESLPKKGLNKFGMLQKFWDLKQNNSFFLVICNP